jgi:phenylacetate-coenzyme A ligase PaaK-like adenylate-forming protein
MTPVIKREGSKMTITVTLELSGNMLEMEDQIQKSVNELGLIETVAALEQFDTNGSDISIEGVKLTSKGQEKKKFKRLTEK